ncbi:MAG: hypothetical protein KDA21_03305, partial [Phycisphaerales bacterium]|nr:hypothetical protein [Phycisphaerales bacterium]
DYYVEAVDGLGNVKKTDIQHVYVGVGGGGGGPSGVVVTPDPLVAGGSAHVEYDPAGGPLGGAGSVWIHYGFDNWSPVLPDALMTWDAGDEVWEIDIPLPGSVMQLDFVFNDGGGTWDNNNGGDWHIPVCGGEPEAMWVMDGGLDAEATEVASNGGLHLYAGVIGTTLYVATEDAGEGQDHFIYVASPPGALVSANWAKAGQIAQWEAFLADENDNDYEGWFDAPAGAVAVTGANGGVLEGTMDLAAAFGSMPAQVYLAVGVYQTQDGGTLLSGFQVPPTVNGDGNIDAAEYVAVDIASITVSPPGPCSPGDADGNGMVNFDDLNEVLGHWGQSVSAFTSGDVDGNGLVDFEDLNAVLGDWGSVCP